MSREIAQVVAEIDAIVSAEDELDRLQELMEEYFASPSAPEQLGVWFRLYERFPHEHGHGVFWTLLHGIEAQPASEIAILESVQRCPTHFPVLMVNRLGNGGIGSVNGLNLTEVLREIAANERNLEGVRSDAARYLGATG